MFEEGLSCFIWSLLEAFILKNILVVVDFL